MREALARRRWVAGELGAMRVRRLASLEEEATSAPTLAEAADRWRASRVDVTDGTAVGHRVQLSRVLPILGAKRVDEITPPDVALLVATLHQAGRKRETIRKSLTVLAQVLDFAGVVDNPARDRVHVRLPREERDEPAPPVAAQIETVLPLMPPMYALAVLVLDATGMRVGELEEKGAVLRRRRRAERSVADTARGREGSMRPLGLPPAGPLRRSRRHPSPTRGSSCRSARLPWADSGALANGDRPSMSSVGHAHLVPARPPSPTYQPLASARRDLGADRRARRSAFALRHGRHVHPRTARRPRARPCRLVVDLAARR
jgi:hypothetical protein